MPRFAHSLLPFLPCLAFPIVVPAQESDPITDLPPAPVYADPLVFDFQPDDLGGVLAEVGAASWRDHGARDLTEALQRVPGVTVSRYNPVGSFGGNDGGSVYVRGHGSSRPGSDMVILTDGIPRFTGVWGHPLIDVFPLDFMESVKVHKSPQPVRVGNMGFAAIDVLPASPASSQPAFQLNGGIGEFNTRHAAFLARGGPDDLRFLAGFSHRRSDGHRPDAFGEVNAATFALQWSPAPHHSLRFHSELSRSDATDPEPVNAEPFPFDLTERYVTDNAFSYLKYTFLKGETRLEARLFFESTAADWTQFHQPPPPPFPAQTLLTWNDMENWGAQLHARGRLNPSVAWEAGVDFLDYGGLITENFSLAGSVGFPEFRRQRTELFALLHADLFQQGERTFSVSAGLRQAFASDTENVLSGQLGATFQLDARQQFFLNLARAHNAIGPYAEFFSAKWNLPVDPTALDNESIDHAEIGYQFQSQRLQWTLTVFHDQTEDTFQLAPPPTPGVFNQEGFSQIGIESHLQLQLPAGWSTSLGITWVDPDQPRPNNPRWSGTAALRWQPSRQWQLGLVGHYLHDRYTMGVRFDEPLQSVDSAFTTSAHLHYHPPFLVDYSGRISLHVENLFDTDYEYRPGYPMPGTHFSLALRLAF